MRWRAAAAALAVAAIVAGAHLSAGPPELTLLNTSLRIAYPLERAGAAFAAALAAAALAWLAPRRWLRLSIAAAALLAAAVAAHLAAYRVEAGDDEIHAVSLLSEGRVAWRDVTRVEAGPGSLVVFDRGEVALRVDTADYRPDQQASLERTIARRVREASRERALPAGPVR